MEGDLEEKFQPMIFVKSTSYLFKIIMVNSEENTFFRYFWNLL